MGMTTRAEVIRVFRERIAQGARLRLSKEDLEVLIEGFVRLLQGVEAEESIRGLCEAEIALLEEGYPQASVAKYLTRYRKVIASAIEEGSLPLSAGNSHHFVHQQRVTGLREERLEHWAMTYLKYSPEVYESIDRRSQLVNQQKLLNLRLVPMQAYLGLLREFLERKGRFEARWLATAIAGLTGRRFAEVVAKGKFSLTEHPYLLHFEGQLKSRTGHGEGYDIVTLVPAAEVLKAIGRLRKLPEVRAITRLKGSELSAALNAFNQKLNSVTGKVLMQVVPPLEGKKTVSIHNLRSLYGAITVHLFCPDHQHEYAFIQHFLGHVMDSPATGHYFRFALCDEAGNLLRDKGTLLTTVPPLPLQTEKVSTTQSGVNQAKNKLIVPDLQTEKVSTTQSGASLELGSAQSTVPLSWETLLEQRLEAMRADFEAQLKQVQQESGVGWFIRRIEGLERENLRLRSQLERTESEEQTLEQINLAQMKLAQMEEELTQLRAENLTLTQHLKQAQDKLNRFRQLLNGEGKSATQGESNFDTPQSNPDPDAEVTTDLHPHKGSKIPKLSKGKAFCRAEAIMKAIKVWNQHFPSESFAISPGLLETVFRIHRRAAKDFFDAYQNELTSYHQEIGVDSPRWHNRGKDSLKLKTFVGEWLERNIQQHTTTQEHN